MSSCEQIPLYVNLILMAEQVLLRKDVFSCYTEAEVPN